MCVNCWDKVKNTHSGCRVWVHQQMEQEQPGVVSLMQREIWARGMDSPLYADFESRFLHWVDKCLQIHGVDVT